MDKTPMDRSTGAPLHVAAPSPRHAPQACHWGDSTLDKTFPAWLNAWEWPWTCCHPAHAGPLETVETCAACPDWRPRAPSR